MTFFNHRLLKGGPQVSTPLSKSMISITNLYEDIDKMMSFCRGREELSSEKNIVRNTYICYKVMVILLILSGKFYVTFFAKTKISL